MTATVCDGMEWPARCVLCGLVTEDPDRYLPSHDSEDARAVACPATGWLHEWARSAERVSLR